MSLSAPPPAERDGDPLVDNGTAQSVARYTRHLEARFTQRELVIGFIVAALAIVGLTSWCVYVPHGLAFVPTSLLAAPQHALSTKELNSLDEAIAENRAAMRALTLKYASSSLSLEPLKYATLLPSPSPTGKQVAAMVTEQKVYCVMLPLN